MPKYHGHGKIVREYKTIKPTLAMCDGCHNEAYHHGLGVSKRCWSYETSRVVDKLAYPSLYDNKTKKYKKTLSCYYGRY